MITGSDNHRYLAVRLLYTPSYPYLPDTLIAMSHNHQHDLMHLPLATMYGYICANS